MIRNRFLYKVNILHIAFLMVTLFSPALFAQTGKAEAPATQANENEAWTGIDVSVVGKYATKYGRPPRDPYINTDKGDLLLFVFTAAGVIGGFVIGFNVHKIFYGKNQ